MALTGTFATLLPMELVTNEITVPLLATALAALLILRPRQERAPSRWKVALAMVLAAGFCALTTLAKKDNDLGKTHSVEEADDNHNQKVAAHVD